MASQDALPKVKRERLESQTMASQDALPKAKRERLESQQAEDLATGGDREETEEKSAKQAEDLATGGDREETEEKSAKQAEDLATGGDREETEEKSAKDRKKHKTSHTFYFCEYGKAAVNTIPCTEAGTVLEALNKSEKFTTLVRKNKEKDILIVRKLPENADIATHFPCWLIKKEEELTIQFSSGNKSDPESPETGIITEESKLVTFYVDRTGGKFCKRKNFLKNMSNTDISYLCIYACVGETAEKALRRDGRFTEIVFQGGTQLMNIKGRDLLEIYLPVTEEQDGKTFKLNMRKEENKSPQPTTKTDSGSEIFEQAKGRKQELGKSTPSLGRLALANRPAQKRGESTFRSAGSFQRLADSGELLQILRSQFEGLVKHMKEREKVRGNEEVLELLREEYGKNIKVFWDVYRVKKLMEMSRSVCILFNSTANLQGTGFLLFDRFILTNAHLIKDSNDSINVNFHREKGPMTKELLPIKEVIAWAYERNEDKCWLDYALLELDENIADLPPPLLTQYGPPIESGGVCIIGHPNERVKGVDFCSVIESTQRETVSEKNKYLIQCMKWDLSLVAKDSPMTTYDTCFFHGASGSPVFNADGQVVAMHTGGYSYKLCGTKSVIEYAIPLQHILQHLLRGLVEKQRHDILQRFIEVARTQDALRPLIAPYTQPDPDSPEPMETS